MMKIYVYMYIYIISIYRSTCCGLSQVRDRRNLANHPKSISNNRNRNSYNTQAAQNSSYTSVFLWTLAGLFTVILEYLLVAPIGEDVGVTF